MGLASFQSLDPQVIMPQILAFVKEAQALDAVSSIVVFGSLATQTMTHASDIDLAIILENKDHLHELKETLRALKTKTIQWPTDLVIFDKDWYESRKNMGGICLAIYQEGKILYQKEKDKGTT